ncbi:MAG TPA: DUF4351 domain-containing protein [Blastocatellia bacterium]|nr:DUF4351 domain-containing protein [Blastocatellia bacterium]HMV84120.1 DUF4351 domain-containing protein [Blastocatellia bacterium]HMX29583.1 DUF4351 domain-containing protein [Blastocatellia bacterium]HMY71242.1 DUF4351 domain-containing protein [Blastocatellia bacterium]HMZ17939.1 DUF4351 domain-containing protein [Blastocatellia bacterium]
MTTQPDYDSPWKDVLDLFFEAAMEFFFPSAYAQIDWSRGYEFLDKELQKITADAAVGRRVVDKLVKVWLKNGQEMWVLLHIEVQGQPEADFTWRVLVYHFRILDRFAAPVATFVILTDEDGGWRPNEYSRELLGTELRLKFSAAKLLDYADRWEELEQSANPFAVVVQAHLTALRTRHDPQDRLQSKWQLTRRLYERGFSKQQIIGLFRFLDWVLMLPKDLSAAFDNKLSAFEEKQKMQYVTSIERRGIERGIQQGLRTEAMKLALRQLQRRVGLLDEVAQAHISALPLEQIEDLSDALLDFSAPSDLTAWLEQHPVAAETSVQTGAGNGAVS